MFPCVEAATKGCNEELFPSLLNETQSKMTWFRVHPLTVRERIPNAGFHTRLADRATLRLLKRAHVTIRHAAYAQQINLINTTLPCGEVMGCQEVPTGCSSMSNASPNLHVSHWPSSIEPARDWDNIPPLVRKVFPCHVLCRPPQVSQKPQSSTMFRSSVIDTRLDGTSVSEAYCWSASRMIVKGLNLLLRYTSL